MRRYTDAERRRAVKDFECGGISAAEFCRRRGMSSVSLAQWRRRYSGNAHSVPAAVPPWLPVVIADADQPAADSGVVYVMIAGTRRLEVPPGFSPADVQVLWSILNGGAAQHASGQCS
jgi:hypothetical protein